MGLLNIAIYAFVTLVNLLWGLVVLIKNPKNIVNRIFFYSTVTIASWVATLYFFYTISDPSLVTLFGRLNFASGSLFIFFLFLFVYFFPSRIISLPRYTISIFTGFTIFLVIISIFSPLVDYYELVDGVHRVTVYGPFYPFYLVHFIFLSLLTVAFLYNKYLLTSGYQRNQVKYLLAGIIASLIVGTTTNVFVPLFMGDYSLQNYGPVATLFFIYSVSHVILKHRFMDIRFIVARTLTYFLLVFTLALFYAFGLFIIGGLFLNKNTDSTDLLVSTSLALFMAFSFQPLRKFFEKVTDQVFYQDHYDSQALLQKFSHLLSSSIITADLSKTLIDELASQIKITSACVVLIKDNNTKIVNNFGEFTFPRSANRWHDLLKLTKKAALQNNEKILVFEELEESNDKKILREFGVSILLPLLVKDEVIGVILLGEKSSGSIYTEEDIDVLRILAPEAAIAIKNTLSYDEIKRFNQTLRHQVMQATHHLQEANLRLQELDQLKDEFISVASHELRTPLTATKSYLWMALNGQGGALTDKQHFYIERSYNSTNRLIRLVNDLLNISRIESGRLSLELNDIDLNQLTKEVIDEISPRAHELSIKLTVNYDSSLPHVIADSDKIKEVLINLIGNSLKFTPQKGSITIDFRQYNDIITTSVSDTGSGMTQDTITHLFQKFGLIKGSYQVNQSATSQGTGLGLYICRQIINMHQGQIKAYSKGINQGSTFTFTLPVSTAKKLSAFRQSYQRSSNLGIIHSKI